MSDDNWLDEYKRKYTPVTEGQYAAAERERDNAEMQRLMDKVSKRLPARHLSAAQRLLADRNASGACWDAITDLMADDAHTRGSDGIFFCGQKGTGKTTAMVAMGWDAARCGVMPWYIQATRFASIVKARHDHTPNLQTLEECGLLIIDELHRVDSIPDWVKSALVGVIDYRYSQCKQTIAAGTLPLTKLVGVLGDEVVDRFAVRIASTGESFRGQERVGK
jgi:DNA replication protein DnaC